MFNNLLLIINYINNKIFMSFIDDIYIFFLVNYYFFFLFFISNIVLKDDTHKIKMLKNIDII